ncbi:MAG: hypothetical protein WED00_11360 [Aquisalimonadaceae bacterium]
MRRILSDMCWLLLPMAVLLTLNIGGARLPTAALVPVWLLFAAAIFAGLWVRALSRRHAFLCAYMNPGSAWRERWRGGVLLALTQLLPAALLAALLIIAIVRVDDTFTWRLLLLNLPALVLMHALVRRALAFHVAARYLPELSWRLTLRLNFLVLFPALAIAAMYGSYPELANATLKQAVWHEMARQEAVSEILMTLMRIAAAKDALGWWLGQQLLPGLGEPLFRTGGWLLLLAVEGLFLWSYLLLSAGMLELVRWRKPQPEQRRSPRPSVAGNGHSV